MIPSQIDTLVNQGYNMIFSNYDALFLDCGFGSYVGEGNNWCSPYKSMKISHLRGAENFENHDLYIVSAWQKIYMNDPYKLISDRNITLTDDIKKQVVGGEVAMWGEQVCT